MPPRTSKCIEMQDFDFMETTWSPTLYPEELHLSPSYPRCSLPSCSSLSLFCFFSTFSPLPSPSSSSFDHLLSPRWHLCSPPASLAQQPPTCGENDVCCPLALLLPGQRSIHIVEDACQAFHLGFELGQLHKQLHFKWKVKKDNTKIISWAIIQLYPILNVTIVVSNGNCIQWSRKSSSPVVELPRSQNSAKRSPSLIRTEMERLRQRWKLKLTGY